MLNTNNTHIAQQQQQQQQQASVYDDPYLFACGGSEGFALLTYSPKNHQCQKISSHRPHGDNRVNTLSWNHNNKVLLSGGEDQSVAMTIADGLKSLGNLRDFSAIKSISISQGSKFLVTGGTDKVVRVWDLKKSCVIREFKDHSDVVTCVTFNSDDRFLATSSRSGFVIIYNMETNMLSAKIDLQETQGIQSISYSTLRPGLLACSGDDGSVYVWDTLRSKLVNTFREHKAPCVSVQWTSLNQLLLISAGLDKRIIIYDIDENKQVKELKSPFPICSFAIHDDGSTIAAGTTVGTVLIFSITKNQKPIEVTVLPSSPVASIAFKKAKKSAKRASTASIPKEVVQNTNLSLDVNAIRSSSNPSPKSTPLGRNHRAIDKTQDMEIFSPLATSSPVNDRPVIRDLFGASSRSATSSLTSGVSTIPTVTSSSNSGFGSIQLPTTTVRSDDGMDIDEEDSDNFARRNINDDSALFAASMKSKLLNSVQQLGYEPSASSASSSYSSTATTTSSHMSTATSVDNRSIAEGSRTASTFHFLNALENVTQSPKRASNQDFSTTRANQSPMPSFEAPHAFQSQFVKGAIEDVMSSYQTTIHESIRNLHLDMLRQFHIHSEETNSLVRNLTSQVQELRQQVDKLQYENKRLKYLHSPE